MKIVKLGIFFVMNENSFEENYFFLISVQILLGFGFIDPLRRIYN